MHADPLQEFSRRVREDWLREYCASRQYSSEGFKPESIRVAATDAQGCMQAIDLRIVTSDGKGRYRAAMGRATEPLFWEGLKRIAPRPITLWLEPVITFAALARLHTEFRWPVELLANQPRSWAFDIAAHSPRKVENYRLLAEVKKSAREADRLISELLAASNAEDIAGITPNSAKKWTGLNSDRPAVLWIVGPTGYSRVFECQYTSGTARFTEVSSNALHFAAA